MGPLAHALSMQLASCDPPGEGEIHVWELELAGWMPVLARLVPALSKAEHERAAQFRLETDRCRFAICRGVLRALLAEYLSVSPHEVAFDYGPYDKPLLASFLSAPLEFNLSHSGERALLAFALRPVGIDIEQVRPQIDINMLAAQVFTAGEKQEVLAASPNDRRRIFFSIWTRKEAYIKAVGLGLAAPIKTLEIGAADDATWQPTLVPGYGRQWSVLNLPAPEGYQAALAVEGRVQIDQIMVRRLRPPVTGGSQAVGI